MRLIIISDTHSTASPIERLIKKLPALNPDLIIHLGDNYVDGGDIIEKGYQLIQVPGLWDDEYEDPLIDNRRLETIGAITFFLSHTPKSHHLDLPADLNPKDVIANQRCQIFLFGHTHHPEIKKEKGILMINPGHLKAHDNRGYPCSYAIMDIQGPKIKVSIKDLADNELLGYSTD